MRVPPLVVLVDGTKLTEIKFKSGEAISVSELDYPTELEAVKAAAPKWKARLLVWCGVASARVARPAESSEHPDAASLADVLYFQKVFGEDQFAVMSGAVALSPDMPSDVAEFLASRQPQMVISGTCVDLNNEGIWVRVGRDVVEATLVHDGSVNGWTQLCKGLDSVAEKIAAGRSAHQARSDLAEQVVFEIRKAIMQWQRTRTVPPSIWLHGPGGDPSGEIYQALLAHSGCRVVLPTTSAAPSAVQHTLILPTAVHALNATRLQQPAKVLNEISRARKQQVLKFAVAVVVVLGVMAGLSALQGQDVKTRIEKAENELATVQETPEQRAERQLVSDAETIQGLLDRMSGSDSPNWGMLFRMSERFRGYFEDDEISIQSNKLQTSISLVIPDGFEGLEEVLNELDEWAKTIYGPDAYALSVPDEKETPGGKLNVDVRLGRQAEVSSNDVS